MASPGLVAGLLLAVAVIVWLRWVSPWRNAEELMCRVVSAIKLGSNLERVGDHATNIAEDALYAAAAEDSAISINPPASERLSPDLNPTPARRCCISICRSRLRQTNPAA